MADRSGNIRFTRVDVERAIREYALRTESSRGRPINMEPVEFHTAGIVQFVDDKGQAVPLPFDSVVLGWKET